MSQFFEYTENGIRFKGFQDLRKTLVDAWEATFGSGIDTSPTSPDGHHIDLEVATINSIAELIQAVTASLNRNQATGVYLDMLAAFLGLQRAEGETDAELRARMNDAENTGLATYDGMLTYLRDKIGREVGLIVNDEPTDGVGGLPGHSFMVVVPVSNSSSNDEIAQTIWKCKPAGIRSVGDVSGYATDITGVQRSVAFSRTVLLDVEVQISLSLYPEEAFPMGGESAVKEAVLGWATGTNGWASAEYTPGKDVIPARFYTPILTVPGISSAEILIRKAGDEEWGNAVIPVEAYQLANLSAVNVSVNVGPLI